MLLGEPSSEPEKQSRIPPYARMWAAVVRRAAVDRALYLAHGSDKLSAIGADANSWIFDASPPDMFNSFEQVCFYLGLRPEVVRCATLGLTEDDARRQRGMEFGEE